jgi:GTP-binding protein Era
METPRSDTAEMPAVGHRSGFVAIIGCPNVGKSTLLNQLLGQKVAIVTPKPQTTRSRVMGIMTSPQAQIIFIDTPGLHRPRNLINRRMVEVAERAAEEADLRLWVVDATEGITVADRKVAEQLRAGKGQTCVVLNKMDRLPRNALLPLMVGLDQLLPGCDVIPVSALRKTNFDELIALIVRLLPEGPRYYDAEAFTDQTERMLAQEVIREKVLLQTEAEVPYAVAVSIDQFEDKPNVAVISATIHVERNSQKGILIGAGGQRIKEIGRAARLELEHMLDRRVYLELFVRVQEGWTKREALLKEFGV